MMICQKTNTQTSAASFKWALEGHSESILFIVTDVFLGIFWVEATQGGIKKQVMEWNVVLSNNQFFQ